MFKFFDSTKRDSGPRQPKAKAKSKSAIGRFVAVATAAAIALLAAPGALAVDGDGGGDVIMGRRGLQGTGEDEGNGWTRYRRVFLVGHNEGGEYDGMSLAECKDLCERQPLCKSIDWGTCCGFNDKCFLSHQEGGDGSELRFRSSVRVDHFTFDRVGHLQTELAELAIEIADETEDESPQQYAQFELHIALIASLLEHMHTVNPAPSVAAQLACKISHADNHEVEPLYYEIYNEFGNNPDWFLPHCDVSRFWAFSHMFSPYHEARFMARNEAIDVNPWGHIYNTELFNADLSRWNVQNGRDFNDMFRGAAAFDQDLSHWTIRQLHRTTNWSMSTTVSDMFLGSGMSHVSRCPCFEQDDGSWLRYCPGMDNEIVDLGEETCDPDGTPTGSSDLDDSQ